MKNLKIDPNHLAVLNNLGIIFKRRKITPRFTGFKGRKVVTKVGSVVSN